ncbi:MAG: sigma-70 family RNA polymerase sigma factor [Planctomycetota bacterium]
MRELSLEQLYQQHGPHVLAYLRRRTGDVHRAEDLLQETFAAAARRPERVRRAASARAWLFGIARRMALSLRRTRTWAALPARDQAVPAAQVDPRLERLREAIAGLPDSLRETLELRLREELSYEEIATVLGIPVGTVRSRLHNAVRLLRRELLGDGEQARKS